MVQLTQNDLQFLFDQVTFDPALRTGPADGRGIREVSGTNNNLIPGQENFGAANQDFAEMLGRDVRADYGSYAPEMAGPEMTFPNGYVDDPMPRIISNLIADQGTTVIPNEAAIPGDLPFNSLMTYFGQFFDHGLDFVDKGAQGFIRVEIQPGDDLYVDPSSPEYVAGFSNYMFVSRANVSNLADAGADMIFGTADDVGYVDVNGNMIADEGDTFAHMKHENETSPFIDQNQTYGSDVHIRALLQEYIVNPINGQAVMTGRLLKGADGGLATWADVKANALKIGITLTDQHVLTGPPLLATDADGKVIYDALGQASLAASGGTTGHSILMDIAHTAVPSDPGYDSALLDAHYIAGDGRINENIGLTAIHEVFHNEHNRIVEMILDMLNQPGQTIVMDGAQIFEAAKLVTEMIYQHTIFDEFARRISPDIGDFNSYDTTIDAAITGEFAHAIYRLGHSMLTENINIYDPVTGQLDVAASTDLITGFLNPELYASINSPGGILMGLGAEVGNAIDEHVTDALRNNLVGLPLDLAAINITRGRDTGLPTLNEVRAQLFAVEGDTAFTPYTSWASFGANMRTPGDFNIGSGSLLNFIAAYGFGDVALASGLAAARNQAQIAMLTVGFMEGTLAEGHALYEASQAFNNIDLWIGGLAEAPVLNGLLGSTFNVIFADQLQRLQDGDRFYYLDRLGGTNILAEIEGENLADLIIRNSDATYLNTDTFSAQEANVMLTNGNDISGAGRSTYNLSEVIAGKAGNDTIDGGAGFDSIYGDDGDDTIEGGADNDFITGGAGNDTITDSSGDDFIRGGDGDDNINAGVGFDLVHGGAGNDIIHGGANDDEIFGGTGNDQIWGDAGDDGIFGGEGDDIIRGGAGADRLEGDAGNDLLIGGAGEDRLHGGDGDDILISGGGGTFNLGNLGERVDGGLGHDRASYETATAGVTADLINFLTVNTGEAQFDNYTAIEGLIGTNFADNLFGDLLDNTLEGRDGADLLDGRDGIDTAEYFSSTAGVTINLAAGTATGGHATGDTLVSIENLSGSAHGDSLTGNAGDNVFRGMGGDDLIDGGDGVNDIAVYSGSFTDYSYSGPDPFNDGAVTISDNRAGTPDGTDTVKNVEFLQFEDGVFATDAFFDGVPVHNGDVDLGDVDEDNPLVITAAQLLAGSFDINGDALSVANLVADSGTIAPTSGPGPFTFTPDGDFNGAVAFTFDVTDGTNFVTRTANLVVNPINDAPVANDDGAPFINSGENAILTVDVLANDTDVDLDPLTVTGVTMTSLSGGSASVVGNQVVFDPGTDFDDLDVGDSRIVTLSYTISDGAGGTDTANVSIRVTGTNDAPVISGPLADGGDEGTGSYNVDLLDGATDAEGHTLSVTNVSGLVNGITVSGSTLTVDTDDPEFDSLEEGEPREIDITYNVIDGAGGSTPQMVTITIVGTNDDPVVSGAVMATVSEDDVATSVDLLAGASDVEGQALTVTNLSFDLGDASGLVQNGNMLDIDPSAYIALGDGESEVIEVSYDIEDTQGGMVSQTATITINGANELFEGDNSPNTLTGTEFADTMRGFAGNDVINGLGGDDILNGHTGNDTLNGGDGIDTADYSTLGSSIMVDLRVVGAQTVSAAGGSDTLVSIENLIGSLGGDTLYGDHSDNVIDGISGNDTIFGLGGNDTIIGGVQNDILRGNDGDDTIIGGGGGDFRDIMGGGSGADTFVFENITDSVNGGFRDRIQDFEQGIDKIDLSAIDAITGGGDDAFTFIGTASFSSASAGAIGYQNVAATNKTIIYLDDDGDNIADMQIELTGTYALTSDDFIL